MGIEYRKGISEGPLVNGGLGLEEGGGIRTGVNGQEEHVWLGGTQVHILDGAGQGLGGKAERERKEQIRRSNEKKRRR